MEFFKGKPKKRYFLTSYSYSIESNKSFGIGTFLSINIYGGFVSREWVTDEIKNVIFKDTEVNVVVTSVYEFKNLSDYNDFTKNNE